MNSKHTPSPKNKLGRIFIVIVALVVAISLGVIGVIYVTLTQLGDFWPVGTMEILQEEIPAPSETESLTEPVETVTETVTEPTPLGERLPIPVILYHHFDLVSENYLVVTPEMFREQMTALKDAGFQTVTVQQINDYVEFGTPLPEKAFMVTMDDGYASNLELAAPILEELGMCATIFVVGLYEGATTNPHTGDPLGVIKFSYEDALPWVEKGVIDVQCHTFDMHNTVEEPYGLRNGMMPNPGESEADYRAAIEQDCQSFREGRLATIPTKLQAIAYPYGYFTDDLENMIEDLGYTTTFSINEYCSILEVHNSDSLKNLGRFNVLDYMSGEYMVYLLTEAYQKAQAKIVGVG